ncbi:toxin HicA [Agromyces sp. ZXT2-3]|uniref:toxin HicA n=1 Tax=Agromyces sp. ZXT2-3 TaxID=3461152 RepID=UPI0040550D93
MPSIEKIEAKARRTPGSLSFTEAVALAEHHFGAPRSGQGSHVAIFKMPWQGDPRINLQAGGGGSAKEYQVKQLVKAIDKLKEER